MLDSIAPLWPKGIIDSTKPNAKKIADLMDFSHSKVKIWVQLWKKLGSIQDCPDEYLAFLGNNLGVQQGNLTNEEYRILLSSYYFSSNGSLNSILGYFMQNFKKAQIFADSVFTVGKFLDAKRVLSNTESLDPDEGFNPTVLIKRLDLEVPLSRIYNTILDRIRPIGYNIHLVDWFFVDLRTPNLKINFEVDNSPFLDAKVLLDGTRLLDPKNIQTIALEKLNILDSKDKIIDEIPLQVQKLPYNNLAYFVANISKKNQTFHKIQWIGVNGDILLELTGKFQQNMVDIFLTFPTKI